MFLILFHFCPFLQMSYQFVLRLCQKVRLDVLINLVLIKKKSVDSVTRSRDGVVRRANIRYFNHGENQARFTDRAVRSLVCLFNVEDNYFIRDMAEVEVFIKELMKKSSDKVDKKVTPIKLKRIGDKEYETVALCIPCGCCCTRQCRWNEHEHGYLVEASPSGKVLPFDRTEAEFQNV